MRFHLKGQDNRINLKGYALFTLLIVVIIFINYGFTTFFYPPCSAHQWRQSDGASYALNYYQNHGSFLPPQVHHRYAQNGYAVSEFPIFYYISSCLYGVFGFHDWILRWVHFGVLFIGLIYLLKLTAFYSSNFLIRIFPSLFVLTSSLIFYYGANFLPDVPSLSLNLVGLYFYIKSNKFKSPLSLIIAITFFTMSALLKFSSVVLFAPVVIQSIMSYFKRNNQENGRQPLSAILFGLLLLFSGTIITSWFFYDKHIAATYHFGGNLIGLYGIWDSRGASISYILSRLYQNWMHVYMAKFLWIQFLLMGSILIVYFKYLNKTQSKLLLYTLGFCIVYFLAFFKVFDVHDYYLINTFVLPILVLLSFFEFAERRWSPRTNRIIAVLCCMSLVYTTYKSRVEQHIRYFEPGYNSFNKDYYTIEPQLRKLGIKKEDLVVSVPDPSPNITLYLMNQIGFTECYNGEHYNIDYFRNSEKAKYFIVGDSNYCKRPLYAKYCTMGRLLGKYRSISIYNLQ